MIAKLVEITPITMVYGRYNELVNEVYKPTNITGGHHLVADFQESHSDMEVEMGVPPVIIHLIFGFSDFPLQTIQLVGYPHVWKPLSGDEAKLMNYEGHDCARMRSHEAKQGVYRSKWGWV